MHFMTHSTGMIHGEDSDCPLDLEIQTSSSHSTPTLGDGIDGTDGIAGTDGIDGDMLAGIVGDITDGTTGDGIPGVAAGTAGTHTAHRVTSVVAGEDLAMLET